MSKLSAQGAKWQAQRLRILNRDSWTCTACGKHLEGADATVDHIAAVATTGRAADSYEDHELTALCRRCNGRKSDRVLVRLDYANPRWLPHGIPK